METNGESREYCMDSNDESKVIKIKHKDLDKFLVVMKYMMDERPDLNEGLMEFYCYLLDKRNDAYYDKQIMMDSHSESMDSNDESMDSNDESMDSHSESNDESIAISLDELIWDMGMNLPSWELDSNDEESMDKLDSHSESNGESNDES